MQHQEYIKIPTVVPGALPLERICQHCRGPPSRLPEMDEESGPSGSMEQSRVGDFILSGRPQLAEADARSRSSLPLVSLLHV